MNEVTEVEIAEKIAEEAHAGQFRQGPNGEPYVNHPKRVAKRFSTFESDDLRVVALLHDVLEDSDFTEQQLLNRGISLANVLSVKTLTKSAGDNYDDYLQRVAADDTSRAVKVADMLDNLSSDPSEKQVKKYAKGLAFLLNLDVK